MRLFRRPSPQNQLYDIKAINCGNTIEMTVYERPQASFQGMRASCGRNGSGTITDEQKAWNREKVAQRAKKAVRLLVNVNDGRYPVRMDGSLPGASTGFYRTALLTLTFGDLVTAFETANYEFKKFRERFKYQYGFDLSYVCVPEFQKRGCIHYHLAVFNMPFIDVNEIAKTWGNGWIKLNAKKINNHGSYLSKYITKGAGDIRFAEKKCYFSSRGLFMPEISKDLDVIEGWLKGKEETFCTSYDNEHTGRITYSVWRVDAPAPLMGAAPATCDTD